MSGFPPGREPIVAVMQPYFFPYAGYYRLLAAADIFVIYDCVQFPRRGYVHRGNVPGPNGEIEWLTLPLARQPRDTLICDLEFALHGRAELDRRLAQYPWFKAANSAAAQRLRSHLRDPLGSVIDFLEAGLRLTTELLDFDARIIRSSQLAVPVHLSGEERVIAIVKAVGGHHYINAPGGRALYHAERFNADGVTLNFLPPYEGPYRTMLHDLMTVDIESIANDIRSSCGILPA